MSLPQTNCFINKFEKSDEYAVFGFIKMIEQAFDHKRSKLFVIPKSIKLICLQYFGMIDL